MLFAWLSAPSARPLLSETRPQRRVINTRTSARAMASHEKLGPLHFYERIAAIV